MTGDGLGRGLSDMWRSVLLFVPAALAFIAIVLVGYVVARLLRNAVAKGLQRAGFDRAVERGAAGRLLRPDGVVASNLCAKIVFYAVLLFALQLAFGIWGPNPVSDLLTALIAWLPRAFVAIVIIVVAAAVASAVHDLISAALGGLGYGRILARSVSVVIVTLGVIAALDQVRIATSVTRPLLIAVLATIAGVLIVGVGGGLIRPMQHRWEGWLEQASAEAVAIREQAKAYADERARQADDAREDEQARQAEEARLADEAGRAEEAVAVPEARPGAEAGAVDEARTIEAARRTEQAGLGEQAGFGGAEGYPDAGEETQVIMRPEETGPRGISDPTNDPASAEYDPPTDDSTTVSVLTTGAADTTIANLGPNDTLVIGSGIEDTDSTQVIPSLKPAAAQVVPGEVADTQAVPGAEAQVVPGEVAETPAVPRLVGEDGVGNGEAGHSDAGNSDAGESQAGK